MPKLGGRVRLTDLPSMLPSRWAAARWPRRAPRCWGSRVGGYCSCVMSPLRTIDDLVAFLRRFHRDRARGIDPRLPAANVPTDLPRPLAILYRELGALIAQQPGDHEDCPFAAQDHLVPVDRLRRIDGMIEFAWENQGNWSCRCLPGGNDSPVYCDNDYEGVNARAHVEVCSSLEPFLITLCLQEAVFSGLNVSEPDAMPAADELRPLWLQGPSVDGAATHDFYVSQDENVLVMRLHGQVWRAERFRVGEE